MTTDCSTDLFGFAPVDGREVIAAFDGDVITSDAGALLLGASCDRVERHFLYRPRRRVHARRAQLGRQQKAPAEHVQRQVANSRNSRGRATPPAPRAPDRQSHPDQG
jgi:hypothetical protein